MSDVTEIKQSENDTDVADMTSTSKGGNNPFIKKCIIFGGIGIVGIAVMITLIVVFISAFASKSDNKKNNFVMYVKDEEVFLNNLKVQGDVVSVALFNQAQYSVPQKQYPKSYWSSATALAEECISKRLSSSTSDEELISVLKQFQNDCKTYVK